MTHLTEIMSWHLGRSPVYTQDSGSSSTRLAQHWGWNEQLDWQWWWFPEESLVLTLQGRCHPGPSLWIGPSMMPPCSILTTKPFVGWTVRAHPLCSPNFALTASWVGWTEIIPSSVNHESPTASEGHNYRVGERRSAAPSQSLPPH